MFFVSIGCVILAVFLLSCSAGLPAENEFPKFEKDTVSVHYSILFIIHGDNNYLYHDTAGKEYVADEEVLASAKKIAGKNPLAEVFIFHQKPRSHFLFFFPLRDGEFYYYRNGRLLSNELYWRDQEQSNLES